VFLQPGVHRIDLEPIRRAERIRPHTRVAVGASSMTASSGLKTPHFRSTTAGRGIGRAGEPPDHRRRAGHERHRLAIVDLRRTLVASTRESPPAAHNSHSAMHCPDCRRFSSTPRAVSYIYYVNLLPVTYRIYVPIRIVVLQAILVDSRERPGRGHLLVIHSLLRESPPAAQPRSRSATYCSEFTGVSSTRERRVIHIFE
jgi:hypothetical protein